MRNNGSVFLEEYTTSYSYLQYKIAILNQRNPFLRCCFCRHHCTHGSCPSGVPLQGYKNVINFFWCSWTMQKRSIAGCILSGTLRKQKYLILAKIRYNHCVLPPGGHAMKHRYHQAVTLLLLLMLLLQMASSSSAETLTKLGNSALRKAIKDSVYADWHI